MPTLPNYDKGIKHGADLESGTTLKSYWKTDVKLATALPHWCAHCGNRSRSKERYCSHCGRRMVDEEEFIKWEKENNE